MTGFGTAEVREWSDAEDGEGGKVAGLHAVRVRDEKEAIAETIDIRRPVLLEMEYETWRPGYVLMPYFFLSNDEGIVAFTSNDLDPEWRGRPRPLGRYVSTVRIPGNY